jgi:putative transposase
VGISRKYSNQLWHMDVTEIKIRGRKVYLQVILDNYSRFIIDWSLMTMWNGQSSSELLERAIQRHGTPLVLMTDGGKENLNYLVSNTLKRYSIKHLVSKMNTHYSNSRVEAFFRMLKHNYLKKVKYTSTIKLKEHINTYILDYNYKIPHSALCGRTPEEAYFGMPKDYYNDHFKEKVREAIQKRVKEYKNST